MGGKRVLVVTHGGTIFCFRYVLERWTYEEAERRFRSESNPNCSLTAYGYSSQSRRLELTECARVCWTPAEAPHAVAADANSEH